MLILKRVRLFGAVTVLASTPLLSVGAQTQSPTPPSASPPVANQPATELPKTGPTTRPADPAQNPLIGLVVFSSDGRELGTVDTIDAEPGGKITAINIKTGGFLGFGTKVVAIPEGKFQRAGDIVQLGMTAEEVSKLPMVKDRA
jgi:sporulation protein YlmC with PRC-barrel domain